MEKLLSGNEAIARGAYEAGVTVAAGYPGTPSTEILESLVQYKDEVYCEWAPNEKVALEMGAGAGLSGARVLVTMKHVGLNVAADPLMTLAYIGVEGGLVLVVADDPGMHSSQNEQDSRHYARLAKVPLLEPADSQEAKDFVRIGLEISNAHRTPVILRTATRISHSRSLVEIGERASPPQLKGFVKNPAKYVTVPFYARPMRVQLEERLVKLRKLVDESPLNRIEWRDRSLGIITSSISYQYVREAWPEASVLKLGWVYPFPDSRIREFAQGVERVVVVEELDDFLEEHVKALGIPCVGKQYIPNIGELSVDKLQACRARMEGRPVPPPSPHPATQDLPPRPPVLCPGCPHRGIFHVLSKHDVVVMGDIGCYSLGTFKPLERLDSILCMGAGVSMAHGMDKAGEPRPVVGILGDSTFFHSGITPLLDIGYNKGCSTIIVVDNRTTAMTGHQEHPGSGRTLMGEETTAASVAEIGRACGIKRIATVNPYDTKATEKVIQEELAVKEPSLIVSSAPCPLRQKARVGPLRRIEFTLCKNCRRCLKLGCPAIDGSGEKPQIIDFLCNGCGLCEQVCPFDAIQEVQE
ncbi:MAG: indolepyruvate ferredoxin oxidoreductase subunit alpha [Phycisphaerae bacterium]|nr:indolepyruvate ferredoxin oxidoreductase subunit alpha [Phycisphaerae bacterium]